MISLDTILQVKPDTWTSAGYAGKNHVKIEVSNYSEEYNEIVDCLKSEGLTDKTVQKIERVQHPFAYGRFLIRKEQLEERNGSVSVVRKFYKVLKSNVDEAVEYNMDTRRTQINSISSFSYGMSDISNYCIIITKRMKNGYSSSRTRDSEEYPEYIVYFA